MGFPAEHSVQGHAKVFSCVSIRYLLPVNSNWDVFKASVGKVNMNRFISINPLNAELNPICHVLALLRTRHIFHVSELRIKLDVPFFFCPYVLYCWYCVFVFFLLCIFIIISFVCTSVRN